MDEKICPILNSSRSKLDVEPMVKCQKGNCMLWVVETIEKLVEPVEGSSIGKTYKTETIYAGCGLNGRR